jgi:glycosyltransferase involved in cell wall biosynthesis
MRILLSAFACEVEKGSEPAVGWNWALRLARAGHDVWVITTSRGSKLNEQACAREGLLDNLHFVYYDQSRFPKFFGKTHIGYFIYLQTWQLGAFALAKRLHQRLHFDTVHHVTFATARIGSFMWKLGIPFTFGPVAGGERIPWRLRRSLPASGKLWELLRDFNNLCTRFLPITRLSFRGARRILVTNKDTLRLISAHHRSKCQVQLAIGMDLNDWKPATRLDPAQKNFKALYVGLLHPRKGINLALRAFAKLHERFPDSEFTIVGKGAAEGWLRGLAEDLNITECVKWVSWLPRDEVMQMYASYDVFLFPSLRDSGGLVVLEALANGLPVICLDLGGPGILVDSSCGRVASTAGASEQEVVTSLAEYLSLMAGDPDLLRHLGAGALQRAQNFTWQHVVASVYGAPTPHQ